MPTAVKLIDVELSHPLGDIVDPGNGSTLKALVRVHGAPIGYVSLPLHEGRCAAAALRRAILKSHHWAVLRHLLRRRLAAPLPPTGLRMDDLFEALPAAPREQSPLVTVAVCTRDRAADLERCLNSLTDLDYPCLELLVVDNAPSTDATERLVRTRYPQVRYLREPRPGLDWARNRAIAEARGEIIVYTDDDAVVDPGWVAAFVRIFAEDAAVMAVTGLVVPYELETEAQLLFEQYGGFGRGFSRRWYRLAQDKPIRETLHIGAGRFGTGANMAFRRRVFTHIGLFDPALDVGTVTNGGGDLEMFFRVLQEGYTLVYEPRAIVRHRHRRDYASLRTQLTNNGVGLYSYLVRSALAYPELRLAIICFGLWWLWRWDLRRLLLSFIRRSHVPRDLIIAEFRGAFLGLVRYPKARRRAAEIEHTFGATSARHPGQIRRETCADDGAAMSPPSAPHEGPTAVRTVDLSQPLRDMPDVAHCAQVRVFVALAGHLLGSIDIANHGQPIGPMRLQDAIAEGLDWKLLERGGTLGRDAVWTDAMARLTQHLSSGEEVPTSLPADVPVSVVVATCDRPEDLRVCLRCLIQQISPRSIEIVVVDNHPDSGVTPPVVAEFPGVVLVNEFRRGLAYARNKGFVASTGDIVIATDDDVTMPPHWLEKLVAPFVRGDVGAVTGNVLPLELETRSQRLFEAYGGLGRGFEPLEADATWSKSFRRRALPTWKLGATANAAFRATIFGHPQIGLMDEALGPGMPSGVGEDTYLFYKLIRSGYTLIYQPDAYVWHRHRRDMPALRRQIYNYSKGHVAYHLTTLLRDHDRRAITRLTLELPRAYVHRIKNRLRGRSIYPLSMLWIELLGNLAGPFALWRSRRRVRRQGRSAPYTPVAQRQKPSGWTPPKDEHGLRLAAAPPVTSRIRASLYRRTHE